MISEEQKNEILDKIDSVALKGIRVHRQHVKDIKTRMKTYDEKIGNMICPKCGGKLLNRKGQYGEFLGCSNYPKCKFKKT